MAELKTDYKDQLLDSSANTKRVYNLVDVDGNVVRENVSLEDVTVYSQDGDTFGAADINKTNEEVNQLNRNLGGFTPIIDSTGKITGYKTEVGADTVFPFKSGIKVALACLRGYDNNLNTTNGASWAGKVVGIDCVVTCGTPYQATTIKPNFKYNKIMVTHGGNDAYFMIDGVKYDVTPPSEGWLAQTFKLPSTESEAILYGLTGSIELCTIAFIQDDSDTQNNISVSGVIGLPASETYVIPFDDSCRAVYISATSGSYVHSFFCIPSMNLLVEDSKQLVMSNYVTISDDALTLNVTSLLGTGWSAIAYILQ